MLIAKALPEDIGLTPLRGFKIDISANPGFHKIFFSAGCDCGTAGLMSVEVAQGKTIDEVRQVLPTLIERLEWQARSFYDMDCKMHRKMRLGPMAGSQRTS